MRGKRAAVVIWRSVRWMNGPLVVVEQAATARWLGLWGGGQTAGDAAPWPRWALDAIVDSGTEYCSCFRAIQAR